MATENTEPKPSPEVAEDPRDLVLSRPLTPRQLKFAHSCHRYSNVAKAGRECDYNAKHADKLSRDPRVKTVVAKLQAEALSRLDLEAGTLDRKLLAIAMGDLATVCTWDRDRVEPIPSHLLSPEVTSSIKAIRATKYGISVELHDPQRAIEKLMVRLGLEGGEGNVETDADPKKLTRRQLEKETARLRGEQPVAKLVKALGVGGAKAGR